jgi:hypothetical protein
VDNRSVFWLINTGVQILVGKILNFGVQQVHEIEIGSMCHLVDNTFEGLSDSAHCYHQDCLKG